jgi:hypothetical protein
LTLGSGSCDFPILHLLDVSSFRNIKNWLLIELLCKTIYDDL